MPLSVQGHHALMDGIHMGRFYAEIQEYYQSPHSVLSAGQSGKLISQAYFYVLLVWASVGKVFTGVLLAQAVMNGEVQLDDPISMYLPEGITAPEYEGRSITLLDLATHTSGLPWRSIKPTHSSYTLDQMYAFLSSYRLTRAPGSSWEYSGFGFGLLGNLLVRRADEEDYEALLVERITRPLAMDSTRIGLTPDMRSHLAPPHDDLLTPSSSLDAPTFAGAGAGLRSTANDMLKFLAANMGLTGTELQPALQLSNTAQRPSDEAFFEHHFPDARALMPDLAEEFLSHPTGVMGTVRSERWAVEDRLLLIGDAAHAITPIHGQGMNCAFEDCRELIRMLEGQTDWAGVFRRFEHERRPHTDAIADMAIENYLKMRDTVRDPKFHLQKALSLELERRFPQRFVPRYSMVMFHDEIPYGMALERGRIQNKILAQLTRNTSSLGQVDFAAAARMIGERLPPIST